MMNKDMLKIKCGGLFGVYGFVAGYKDSHFGAALIRNREDGVEPVRLWEFSNKIH